MKKTSASWLAILQSKMVFHIIDHDGWDRRNFKYSFHIETITKEEFIQRLENSTVQGNANAFDATKW